MMTMRSQASYNDNEIKKGEHFYTGSPILQLSERGVTQVYIFNFIVSNASVAHKWVICAQAKNSCSDGWAGGGGEGSTDWCMVTGQ